MLLQGDLDHLSVLFYFFDDIIIVNKDGIIEYAETLRPDLYSYTLKSMVGKHIYDTYEKVDGSPGSLYEVLKTGNPIFDRTEHWKTIYGNSIRTSASTLPIVKDHEIMGAIEVSRYIGENSIIKQINLENSHFGKTVKAQIGAHKYYTVNDMITQDPVMLGVKQKVEDIARYDAAVMVIGETGTGKEVVAQAIHSHSSRVEKPFVSQNCAALPESLAESILFGTERGSFTGAESRKGLFELAQGGTLFLDEISSMDISLQAKLLKAIEDKQIRRLGGQRPIDTDVRIISALNEDPFELIPKKRLRSDLLYRLNTISIYLPPLKERTGDVLLLAGHYIDYYNSQMEMDVKGISSQSLKRLCSYNWPGNVRELKNTIESAFHNNPGERIEPEHLPHHITSNIIVKESFSKTSAGSFRDRMEAYEKQLLLEALARTRTKTEAAKLLQMSKQTLNYRLGKFGLE